MNGLQAARFIHSATNWSPKDNAMLLALILVGERANPNVAMSLLVEG